MDSNLTLSVFKPQGKMLNIKSLTFYLRITMSYCPTRYFHLYMFDIITYLTNYKSYSSSLNQNKYPSFDSNLTFLIFHKQVPQIFKRFLNSLHFLVLKNKSFFLTSFSFFTSFSVTKYFKFLNFVLFFCVVKGENSLSFLHQSMMLSIKNQNLFFTYVFLLMHFMMEEMKVSMCFFMVCWLSPLSSFCIMKGDNYVSFRKNTHCS